MGPTAPFPQLKYKQHLAVNAIGDYCEGKNQVYRPSALPLPPTPRLSFT
jgi:hypothetical protein